MNDTINRFLAILCAPFASLDFFLEDYFAELLECKVKESWSGSEEKLQKIMISYISKNCNLYSYDEVYMYLEKCYLYDLRTQKYQNVWQLYLECFHKIMYSMISQRDGKIVFKYWENQQEKSFLGGFGAANKIFLFHSMNMHIPLDFIVMLFMAQNPQNTVRSLDGYFSQIEIADQQLAAVLRGGVAENHLHKGVSVSFFEVWDAFMKPLDSRVIHEFEALDISLGDQNRKNNEILLYILSAAVARVWIALALQRDENKDHQIAVENWMPLVLGQHREKKYQSEGGQTKEKEAKRDPEWIKIVKMFLHGKELADFYRRSWGNVEEKRAKHEILSYFQELWEEILTSLSEQKEGRSMIQDIFCVPEELYTSDENIFLFYAMRSLQQPEQSSISQCMLQYLRIKHYVFGCMVQKKTIRGLDYFQKEFYSKDSKMNKFYGKVFARTWNSESKIAYWELAMRKQFQNSDLRKIEFRTSIDQRESEFRGDVKAFLEAYRNVLRADYCRKEPEGYKVYRTFPRVGLIFHFIKCKDPSVPDKCFLDGLEDRERMQFGVLREEYQQQLMCMHKLREELPGLDRYLVGIDAASLENSTPVWVFSRIYEKARDSSIERIGYGELQTQSLRFTFHAGEDFRHMLSGLRRMDEAVTFLKFHAGDRIGHGTVLGIVPKQWKRWNPFVVLPRIEALENYIWAHYLLSKDLVNINSTIMAYIERQVYKLAKDIYGGAQGLSIEVLTEGYLKMFQTAAYDLGRCKEAEDVGFCWQVQERKTDEIIWNGEKLALARHCRKFLTEMEYPIHYEVTDQDIQITEMLQNILRQKLSRKGIVVEINPSSNVAIGEVDKIMDNQIYHLNQPGRENNVMVCINSDDPTVFHTNVSNELAYIYYGMLYRSVSRETVLEWVDKVRECGIRASFIQGEESDQQVYDTLEELILRL